MILLILMANGWTIKYKEFPDLDIFVPIAILVVMINMLIVGLGRITDDSYYKFSDLEGIPGILIIGMRLMAWCWFVYSIFSLYN